MLIQYFFINLPMLTTSETLSAEAWVRPLWLSEHAEAHKGREELLMRSGLTVGNIYMIKAFTWRFVLDI